MFKLKQWTFGLFVCLAMFSTLTFVSCSSDDDEEEDPQNECLADFSAGAATGLFMGDPFTVVTGTATENFADATEFRITLYGETVMGDACDGFNFEKPDSTIIFTVPMEIGVYDILFSNSVTFNDASVVNEVTAEVSTCGAIEILSISETEVTGRIDAKRNTDSELNGTFTLERCN